MNSKIRILLEKKKISIKNLNCQEQSMIVQ